MLAEILWNALLAVAGTALVWFSSARLETASLRVADFHRIPEVVKGAVITAVASSFPELSSIVLATLLHGEFNLGMAGVLGSAIFNIMVIPAGSVLAAGRIATNQSLFYKEGFFYMVAVFCLTLTCALAVIYHPLEGEALRGQLTRGLMLMPLGLYALYLYVQYQDTRDYQAQSGASPPEVRILTEWLMLLGCMLVIALGVELLLRSALNFGRLLNTPSFLWGLTIVSAGSSLPDLFISIKAAREGKSLTCLSNVLGSNTFDLLVAVPVGVLLGGAVAVNFSRAAPVMGCLMAATIMLFVMMRTHMQIRRLEGAALLALYVLFVVWMVLESVGVTRVLNM